MFKSLMPKEESYFDDFNQMINHTEEMAQLTYDFFSKSDYDPDIFFKLKPIEKRCDEISSSIVKRLNKTFITPLDREDIFALAKRIDGIGDILLSAAAKIDIYGIKKKIDSADKLSAIILQQIKELKSAIRDMSKKGDHFDSCKAVKDLESEGDHIFRNAIKKLFQEEKDPIELIKQKEILDMLENACDKCQSTANIIIQIMLKNS